MVCDARMTTRFNFKKYLDPKFTLQKKHERAKNVAVVSMARIGESKNKDSTNFTQFIEVAVNLL